MWESPINAIQSEMMMKYEDGVMKAVQRVGFDVNKEELTKAFQYDRNQYNKGYTDAIEEFAEAIKSSQDAHMWSCRDLALEFCNGDECGECLEKFKVRIDEIAESMKGEKE